MTLKLNDNQDLTDIQDNNDPNLKILEKNIYIYSITCTTYDMILRYQLNNLY